MFKSFCHAVATRVRNWSRRLKRACWWREFGLRVVYFCVGFVFGDAWLYVLKHTLGVDQYITRSVELWVNWVTGFAFIALLELIVTHMEFKFPHKECFKLRSLIAHFIESHVALDDQDKARVALSLVNSNRHVNEIEFETDFINYLKLLSAAVELTQTKWFATYLLPIDEWHAISDHSHEYFSMLKKRRLAAKIRVVVAPKEELAKVNNDSLILAETFDCGARLGRVPREGIFANVRDYALFDDHLVIEAVPLGQNDTDGNILYVHVTPHTRMHVRLIKDDLVSEYVTTRKRIMNWLNVHRDDLLMPAALERTIRH